ncbi:MAG: NAD(P)/FAD-dependent oxidoreductase [Bacteroidales bacterium]|nr:NAD(P)/FAD-dependent oxidoreductase [Bacteroidales bacterium]
MQKKVIIIGGGVAGLSCGIYGQLNGYDNEILEMHSLPGGKCTAWKRKGYTFDYCIHWLVGTASGPFYDIWQETGALDKQTRIWDPETFATLRMPDGEDFIIYADIDRWEKYLVEMAPEDREPIGRMCEDMRRMATMEMFGDPSFRRGVLDYARFMRRSASAVRLFIKYGRTSLGDYFKKLNFRNKKLNEGLLGIGAGMEDFSAIAFLFTLLWFSQKNAGYPLGGSMPFTRRMADKYKALGGVFTGRSRVEKIITLGKQAVGVRLTDGTLKYADYIIGACDLHALMYDMLEGKYLTPKIEKAFAEWPLFKPIVQVSFGIRCRVETKYHTYQLIAPGESIGSTVLTTGYGVSNYNHDPLICPAGKCVMKLLFDSPFEIWEGMDKKEYHAEKARIAADATEKLEKLYPDVQGNIEVVDVATPPTNIRYTGVHRAAYEGFLPTSKNMTRRLPDRVKGLDNFFLAGQWLFPGGGLPPSAQSGKWLFQWITKKDKKKFRTE